MGKMLSAAVTKTDFYGDMLAVIGFCNLWLHVDQYELAASMRFFGITSAEQPAVRAAQEKHYTEYKQKFPAMTQQGDFCGRAVRHPFFVKILRRGFPVVAGSDDRRQPEKIEFFGNMLGPVFFCKITLDENEWGRFLFEMGLKSESVSALNKHAMKVMNELNAQNSTPSEIAAYCQTIRASPAVARFVKR